MSNRLRFRLTFVLVTALLLTACGPDEEVTSDHDFPDTGDRISDTYDGNQLPDTRTEDTRDSGEQPPAVDERVRDYIRNDSYSRLVLEVDFMTGVEPTAPVIDDLVTGLTPLLDKPDGIEVVLDEELAPRGTDHAWTFEELANLENQTFDFQVDENTIKIHVLFVDGHDARDDDDNQILGLSWANRNVVLYKESLDRLCESSAGNSLRRQGLVEEACNQTQLAIWTHELGHVIGLVDLGLPMVEDHEDPEHEHHDHNEECVMYWAYDRRQAFDEIGKRFLEEEEDISLGFDAACRADIAAVRTQQ